ncbi:MAG: hypothetical protein CVV19_02920 [Gammaproteobacteria bacterium HGW-Gammaproteobacteria-9]|uniref:hypothetical protein n=1 Tax=Pseudomonadaceae TaxID=135621 RepID=UPI0005B55DA3|nr:MULTISPECIES: hypothetical protein [Pseudomonadaceae]NMY66379.1 hypothetical protein [Pseudomonas sp. WS 5018]PKM00614.1 MAG: hypothetical protein CVV19_02920 [Gammaproteobacteria bacterium HGW-Gammaproteobacteria-9]KJS77923.1 MAG: lipoprotein [[Pseudomonas] sp. BICA1-14]MDD2161400.1 hypothetical protein [Pseudomonas sp. MIL19]UUC85313.1 hypothetical protein NPN27_09345 [Stutzerimonas stutzeri]
MKKMLQMTAFGLLLVGLAGCDAAEQSAQKLLEKTEQAVQDVAREAIDETLQHINKKADDVQQSTNEWLGKPSEEPPQDQAEKQQPQDHQPVEPIDKTAVET